MMFFSLSSLERGLILFWIVGSTLVGWSAGRGLRAEGDASATFGVIQAALLGLLALILALSPTMAVDRYDARRTAVVDEANAIGTTYLRAQTSAPRPSATRRAERDQPGG